MVFVFHEKDTGTLEPQITRAKFAIILHDSFHLVVRAVIVIVSLSRGSLGITAPKSEALVLLLEKQLFHKVYKEVISFLSSQRATFL